MSIDPEDRARAFAQVDQTLAAVLTDEVVEALEDYFAAGSKLAQILVAAGVPPAHAGGAVVSAITIALLSEAYE